MAYSQIRLPCAKDLEALGVLLLAKMAFGKLPLERREYYICNESLASMHRQLGVRTQADRLNFVL